MHLVLRIGRIRVYGAISYTARRTCEPFLSIANLRILDMSRDKALVNIRGQFSHMLKYRMLKFFFDLHFLITGNPGTLFNNLYTVLVNNVILLSLRSTQVRFACGCTTLTNYLCFGTTSPSTSQVLCLTIDFLHLGVLSIGKELGD